jgi:hypothetical protein
MYYKFKGLPLVLDEYSDLFRLYENKYQNHNRNQNKKKDNYKNLIKENLDSLLEKLNKIKKSLDTEESEPVANSHARKIPASSKTKLETAYYRYSSESDSDSNESNLISSISETKYTSDNLSI